MSEQIKKVPAVALRGMTILPGMIAHFDVSRERSIHAVEQAMMDDEQIFLVTQKNAEENEPEAEDLYQIGILASIKQVIKMQDNIVRVLVEGTTRAQLQELFSEANVSCSRGNDLFGYGRPFRRSERGDAAWRAGNLYQVLHGKPEDGQGIFKTDQRSGGS